MAGHPERPTTLDLLAALQEIQKRAERVQDDADVISTYVGVPGLVNALGAGDNGIVYGRRGTGKTHALRYLAEREREKGNLVVYIDIAQDLGSTEGLYGDSALPIGERATRLLVDVLGLLHDALMAEAFEGRGDLSAVEGALEHWSQVVVAEKVEQKRERSREDASSRGADLGGRASTGGAEVSATVRGGAATRIGEASSLRETGMLRYRVHFGAVADYMRKAVDAHPADRIWLLFDEWSGLQTDLQPYLAEMLRRIFFGSPKTVTRIAAIPHRTAWRIPHEDGTSGYTGLETGSEIFPLLDLDEFVVFPARSRREQTRRSTEFFKALLTRHLNAILAEAGKPKLNESDDISTLLFTQSTALEEMVRAAEGVPRDALQIVSRAALRAGDTRVSTDHVRSAAAQVYQTTKAALLNGAPEARRLLEVIIDDVVSGKKARAFLLRQESADHPLIHQLVDERLLHVIKRGYSHKGEPGARFDVLQIDYGCYVHMLATTSAPQMTLQDVGEDVMMEAFYGGVEVPEDDYRAIRRAELDLQSKLEQIKEVQT